MKIRAHYTASDMALERAAFQRKAIKIADKLLKTLGVGVVLRESLRDTLNAIPTDQPALGKHDVELLARETEARLRVLLANENLRTEIAKHKAEIAKHKAEIAAMLEKAAVGTCIRCRESKFWHPANSAGIHNHIEGHQNSELCKALHIRALISTDYAADQPLQIPVSPVIPVEDHQNGTDNQPRGRRQ